MQWSSCKGTARLRDIVLRLLTQCGHAYPRESHPIFIMEAIGSVVQPSELECARMEPPRSTCSAAFSDSLPGHLMCCESFTEANMDSLDVRGQQHLSTCTSTAISVSSSDTTTYSNHLYGYDQPAASPLHVEVLQHSCSSLSAAVVREYVVAQLKRQPTAFGGFTMTEFEDPVLKEHVVSISVCDIPDSVQVVAPM